jgi:hypothetical protein
MSSDETKLYNEDGAVAEAGSACPRLGHDAEQSRQSARRAAKKAVKPPAARPANAIARPGACLAPAAERIAAGRARDIPRQASREARPCIRRDAGAVRVV